MHPSRRSKCSFDQMSLTTEREIGQTRRRNQEARNSSRPQSPLVVQRKQLQKDLDDWRVLITRSDLRRLQEITDRVEHMNLFNRKVPVKEIRPSCSYRVRSHLQRERRVHPGCL